MPDAKQLFLQTMPLLLHRFSEIFQYLLQNRLRWVLKELPQLASNASFTYFCSLPPIVRRKAIFLSSYCLILYIFNSLDARSFFMVMTIKIVICFLVFMDIDIKSFRGDRKSVV